MDDFSKKIQNMPEDTRKLILWAVTILLGLFLFFLWARGFETKINALKGNGVNDGGAREGIIPGLEEQIERGKGPMEEDTEETLRELEKLFEEAQRKAEEEEAGEGSEFGLPSFEPESSPM